ncbi:hypothetical protein HHI36_007906 [Cryptolaemus montrouzieri]|uniref:PHD-type domain-containing protein n=1 Tax=Cryptolaemus montrouzieri TaxID=559131 RepID=A0ABD2MQX8_9CUCU
MSLSCQQCNYKLGIRGYKSQCCDCELWFHKSCITISATHFERFKKKEDSWTCSDCFTDDNNERPDDKMLSNKPRVKPSDPCTLQDVMTELNCNDDKYDLLLSKFVVLVKENRSLKTELNEVKQEVTILKNSNFGYDDVISEINDRSLRARNVILLDVTESELSNLNERIAHDTNEITKLLAPAGVSPDDVMKVVRIGEKGNKSRPTKVAYYLVLMWPSKYAESTNEGYSSST